jgi:hypothetical protein
VDEYLEKLQLLRDKLAARKDQISQVKRQLREERQLRTDHSADEELEKQGKDRQRADKLNRRSADEELGKLSNRSADGELGKQSQDRQLAEKFNRRSADEELGKLSADDELGKQSQDRQRADEPGKSPRTDECCQVGRAFRLVCLFVCSTVVCGHVIGRTEM